jgi:hypothetical protein
MMLVLYSFPVLICSTLGNEGLFVPPRADSESQPDATDSDSWAIDFHSTLGSPLSTKLFQ